MSAAYWLQPCQCGMTIQPCRCKMIKLNSTAIHCQCHFYQPRSKGDNTFGSVCPSVRPSVLPSALSRLNRFYTMCMLRSGRYMGSTCRVLRKNTMTHEIQSKTSVCLSVIKERSRSKSCAQRSGAFNFIEP